MGGSSGGYSGPVGATGALAGGEAGAPALAGPVGSTGPSSPGPPGGPSAERSLTVAGRVGLVGRTGFYLLLTGIAARIAALGGAAHQADAQGALALVCRSPLGEVAVGLAAAGFVLLGAGRVVGAWRDRGVGAARRAVALVQGLFYVGVAWVPSSYLAGNHQSGSQQSQRQATGRLLALPGGRALVVAIGVVLVAVCAVQVRGALERRFEEGLELGGAPAAVRRLAGWAGVVGLAARALVVLPIGVFLVVAGVRRDPGWALGTDGELLRLSGHPWGVAVLAAVCLGLLTTTAYSAIEARYRRVVSAR